MPDDQRKAIASRGGKAKVPKGFALLTPERRRELGSKGGQKRKENNGKNSISSGNSSSDS